MNRQKKLILSEKFYDNFKTEPIFCFDPVIAFDSFSILVIIWLHRRFIKSRLHFSIFPLKIIIRKMTVWSTLKRTVIDQFGPSILDLPIWTSNHDRPIWTPNLDPNLDPQIWPQFGPSNLDFNSDPPIWTQIWTPNHYRPILDLRWGYLEPFF